MNKGIIFDVDGNNFRFNENLDGCRKNIFG